MRQYVVSGMSCAACQARVEKAVNNLAGVDSCVVSLLTNSMSVEGNAADEEIIKAVVDAGYGAAVMNAESEADVLEDRDTPVLVKRLIASIVLLVVLMLIPNGWIQMVLTLAVMIINRKFFTSGWNSVIHGAPNMDTLVAMGSGVSFLWSCYVLLSGSGDLYFHSAAMILTLITVGKMLEARSKGKTTDAIKALMRIAPKTAFVIRDGVEECVAIEEVRNGDRFVVRPGMSVPVDGVVLEGTTSVDESSLTGESVAVDKVVGSVVKAATINLSGEVICEATRVGEDTTFAQIIQLVRDAAATKAPIAKVADRVAGVFVPAVIGIALITFIAWMLGGSEAEYALTRAIAVLVISCPCSLGLATPVAIMVANGVGAKNGILFKNAESIELAGKVKVIALDKTGTITEGKVGSDTVKADSMEAIADLKAMGLKVVMISGDQPERAKEIANQVGIDDVVAGVLPDGKDAVVKELQGDGLVAMVGDGINDAPALTVADVGIAIGAGTDVAIDAADVVLMNSNLSDVVKAIKLSKQALRIIHQNLFWAFIYNVIGIPVAAGCFIGLCGWELSPMLGAACMSLSSFCVVSNALRLNMFKLGPDRAIAVSVKEDKTMTKTMVIEGMMCMHCEARVKKTLEAIEGVTSADVSHTAGTAIAHLAAEVDDAILKKAVEDQDYKVVEIK